jgi:hypothetical protein
MDVECQITLQEMRKNVSKYFPRNKIKTECKRLEQNRHLINKRRGHGLSLHRATGPDFQNGKQRPRKCSHEGWKPLFHTSETTDIRPLTWISI